MKGKESTIKMLQQLKKISIKLIFPIEFVLSVIFSISMYLFVTTKIYEGYWSRNLLFILFPITIILIGIIIYNCKNNKMHIEKVFLSFMIPLGLCFLFFIEPTYTPDENAHLWKSYEISEGILITPIDENGKSHTEVPEFLAKNMYQNIGNYQSLNSKIAEETDYNKKVSLVNPAQNYPPILYIFSSIGLKIGRILNLNGMVIQYIARMMNYIAFLLFSYFAIKKIPFGKMLLSVFLFMPMIIQQAVSISADSLLNSVLIFYIAYNIYLLFKKEKIKKSEIVAHVILSIFVGLAKIVYLPLVGMSLFFIFKKGMPKNQKKVIIITSIVLSVVISCLWYVFSMRYSANQEYLAQNNVNAIEQIKLVLTNPLKGLDVIYKTLVENGESYIFSMVGSNLGWLDIVNPYIVIVAFIILIVLSIFFEKNEVAFTRKQRLWNILLAIMMISLVLMALYVGWTTVGGDIVEGVQGRYFIPIALLILLCCSLKENYVKIKNVQIYFILLLCLLNINVLCNIVTFFA